VSENITTSPMYVKTKPCPSSGFSPIYTFCIEVQKDSSGILKIKRCDYEFVWFLMSNKCMRIWMNLYFSVTGCIHSIQIDLKHTNDINGDYGGFVLNYVPSIHYGNF